MAEKLLVELQDDKGNIFYLHTTATAVFCTDGKTVQEKIGNVKGMITTKESLKSVSEQNYLVDAKTVKDCFDEVNKKIYGDGIVLIDFGSLPNATKKMVQITGAALDASRTWIASAWVESSNNVRYPMPYVDVNNAANNIQIIINADNQVEITTKSNWANYRGYVCVAYKN